MPKRVIALSRSSPAERTLGFWLRNARHANLMARRVRDGLAAIPGVRFRGPTEINFALVALP